VAVVVLGTLARRGLDDTFQTALTVPAVGRMAFIMSIEDERHEAVRRSLETFGALQVTVNLAIQKPDTVCIEQRRDAPDRVGARQRSTKPGLPEPTGGSLLQGVEASQSCQAHDEDAPDDLTGGDPRALA
jgi:hypothetical protein